MWPEKLLVPQSHGDGRAKYKQQNVIHVLGQRASNWDAQ